VPEERDAVLSFWFGELSADGLADAEHAERWWEKDAAFDALVRERFGALHAAIAGGKREPWLQDARGTLAYVIVLDQFSRNAFRDTPGMFEQDPQALRAALSGLERGFDRALAFDERGFLYMPLVHAEDPAHQDRAVTLFTALRDASTGSLRERAASSLGFAQRHRDIVQRFGRFPHRNGILSRTPTPDEMEFLTQPGSSF
jgi:uncharacterized protein (DUF924 family)